VACPLSEFSEACVVNQDLGTCYAGFCLPAGPLTIGEACNDIDTGGVNSSLELCEEGTVCASGANSAAIAGTCQPICFVHSTSQDGEAGGDFCDGDPSWGCTGLSWESANFVPGVGVCFPREDGGSCLVGAPVNELDSCGGYGDDLCACPLSCVSSLCVYDCEPDGGCEDPNTACANGHCFPPPCFPDGGCASATDACYLGACYQTCDAPYECNYTNLACDAQLGLCL
jgi:hypothetical protein